VVLHRWKRKVVKVAEISTIRLIGFFEIKIKRALLQLAGKDVDIAAILIGLFAVAEVGKRDEQVIFICF